MGHFLTAMLNGGAYSDERILLPETVTLMHTQQVTAHPEMPGIAYGFFENYSNGRRVLFHTGLRNHSALMFLVPEEDIGVYVVGRIPEGSPLKRALFDDFIDTFFPSPEDEELTGTDEAGDYAAYRGFYRMHMVPQTTFEKFFAFGTDAYIAIDSDSTMTVRFPWMLPATSLTETGSGLFRSDNGGYFAVSQDENGRHVFAAGGISDVFSLTRIPWYESAPFNIVLGALGGLSFASYFLLTPLSSLIRRLRKREHPDWPRPARRAWATAGIVSGLVCAAPASMVIWLIINSGPAISGVPPVFYILETFLLLASIIGLSLIVLAFLAWRRGWWRPLRRVYFTWIAVAALVMIPWFNYWNLIGYRF